MKAVIEMLASGDWLNDARVRRIAICCSVLFPLAFGVEMWLHTHFQPGTNLPISFPVGQDFSNFWAGSVLALQGNARAVFDLSLFSSFQHGILPPFHQFRWYAYPPTTLLLFLPWGLLPYLLSYALWLAIGTLICAWILRSELSWPMAFAAAAVSPASFINAISGQNGAFTAAIVAAGIVLLDDYPVLAGFLISLMCLKPQLAILFPLVLVAAKRWDVFVAAAIGCLLIVTASILLFGSETWQAFFHVAPLNEVILERGHLPAIDAAESARVPFWYRMPTAFAAAKWFGAGNALSYAIQIVSAILAASIAWKAWRTNADLALKGAIFIFATLAVTPYAWDYDLVMLTFAIVWLWTRGKRVGFLPYEKTLIGCLYASTLISPTIERVFQFPLQLTLIWLSLLFSMRHFHVIRLPFSGRAVVCPST